MDSQVDLSPKWSSGATIVIRSQAQSMKVIDSKKVIDWSLSLLLIASSKIKARWICDMQIRVYPGLPLSDSLSSMRNANSYKKGRESGSRAYCSKGLRWARNDTPKGQSASLYLFILTTHTAWQYQTKECPEHGHHDHWYRWCHHRHVPCILIDVSIS